MENSLTLDESTLVADYYKEGLVYNVISLRVLNSIHAKSIIVSLTLDSSLILLSPIQFPT
jgi:hypothetical protein